MIASSSSVGERVGRYQLLGELGQGGTATVHVASASGPGGFSKLVVLKKMKHQFASEPGFAEMFMVEARLAARLNHPNIVQTNEVFDDDGLPVIVMEYLEGKSLADIAAARQPSSPFTLQHYLSAISEALSGLHYSHELLDYKGQALGLVHRDVTPHNLFVTYAGQVKVLDFGIAKLNSSTVETETGIVKGKLRYIPPEQMIGERIDRRADIYSVGVILWEAAVGEKMWRGLSDAAVMNRVINEQTPRPQEKNPKIDARLETLIMKALAADPGDRHQTALELQQELDAVREHLPGSVSPRELGPALELMFGEERARTRALIERRLSDLAEVPESRPSARMSSSASLEAVSHRRPPTGLASARSIWWFLAFTVPLSVYLLWPKHHEPAEHPAPEATLPPIEQRVRITVFPRDAELRVDGALVQGNPFVTSVPIDAREHVVEAAAPGHEGARQSFTLDREVDIVLRLAPVPAQDTAARSGSAAPAAALDTAAAGATAATDPSTSEPTRGVRSLPNAPVLAPGAPAPAVSNAPRRSGERAANSDGARPPDDPCDPPYTLDARGIKRFKLECMQ